MADATPDPNNTPLRPLAKKSKPSKVEAAKAKSHHLRGTIRDVLENGEIKSFEHDDMQLLKFHGIYQQDDRDARAANKLLGLDPEYSFMIRVKIPGGQLTPEQYLALDQLGGEFTYNQSVRVTTRQAVQLHGILKGTLADTIRRINEVLLSTLSGCGDVERNVMAPPAPLADPAHKAARDLAAELSSALCPATNAYYEVWLNGKKVHVSESGEPEHEPLYGETYLPRKFKTGIALVDDNAVDAHSQDVGLIALIEDGRFAGVNVLVGGGLGMTHKKEETYARLGSPLGYVDAEHAVEAVRTVAAMFRDYGDRTDRKHARLKYVVEEYGIDAFRAEFQSRVSFQLQPWREIGELEHQDWLGAHDQGDGRKFFGVYVPNGRIIDEEGPRYRTAVRKIVESLRCPVILTPNQNVIFADLDEEQVTTIERVLAAYNVPMVEQMSWIRRGAMACPALPTCGLALTESERVIGDVLDDIEATFAEFGLENEPLTIRMTGCPNGCARPYTADIGLVGHKPGHYDVFLGGSRHGHRMAELYAENVPEAEVGSALRAVVEAWSIHRRGDEPLSDFYDRVFGDDRRRDLVTGSRDNPAKDRVAERLVSLNVSAGA